MPTPVFLPAEPCERFAGGPGAVPELLRNGLRAVRSYDEHHDLVEGEVVAGTELEASVDRLFADDRVRYLHVHSATMGCFTCRVDRSA